MFPISLAVSIVLNNVIDTNSHVKKDVHIHFEFVNTNKTTGIWLTVLPETNTWSSIVTEEITGTPPSGLIWSPEFTPVGSSTTSVTFPAQPDSIYLSISQAVRYETTCDFWAEHISGPIYSPPAYQIQYSQNPNGTYNYWVKRESSVFRNFQSAKVFYMIPNR